ncbi:MAG: transporter substrate-binding domain-containing protein [Paraburkholderia sp.]|uniref:ATP-binding protein n=1 Tax=Paraburkholderia sp. TaxID=1926495 RepID=UPI001214C596|nr:ATP-binding protein [Paraburkholderia sp.]TAL97045.1 MAG: transporter substrate-binding domain-containing protein [Paraburkholderia sp.]
MKIQFAFSRRNVVRRAMRCVLVCVVFAVASVAQVALAVGPLESASAALADVSTTGLTIGMLAGGWAPFESVNGANLNGLSVDYLRALVGPGVTFETRTYADMPQLLDAACKGQVDVLMSAARTPGRDRCLLFTAPYFRAPLSVVTREERAASFTRGQLQGARLATEKGFALEDFLGERYPRAHVLTYANTLAALAAVERGEADAYLGFAPAVRAELSSGAFASLDVAFDDTGRTGELRFAVPRQHPAMRDDLDRALSAMSQDERRRIRNRWIAPPAPPRGIGSISAMRLLPFLIAIGAILIVTLRAYALLQREMRLRKRTERELATQLNFQQTMMEMVPYPLVAKDLDGRYIAVNRAYEASTGLARSAVTGRTSLDVKAWGAANSESLDRMTRRTLESGAWQQVELEFTGRAGDVRHGLFWTCLCTGIDGTPSCVLGTLVDITDIRQAEVHAHETERRLFDVTRSLPAVVFQLRRDPSGAYSFLYVGGDTQGLLGNDGRALTEPGSLDFGRVCAEDRRALMVALERSARSRQPVHVEFRFDGGGPGFRWVRAELVPRREAAHSIVWSGYGVDASVDHARADELARARDVAEAASRAKDDFLAMMSHEIRTPMNGVLGLVEVLERTPLKADQGEMLGMIHESAGALLQILDDLLDYSKIEAGRLTIESEPIELRELVDNAVGLLAGRAHEKGLKVRVDVEPDVAASLRGDSVRLRQILFNLLGNAIKFTPAGEVAVRVALHEQTDSVQSVDIVVEDTGIGIAPDVQARLFEPFVQAESSTTRRFGGTGLGLTICRKLVDLMGGTLELQSTPGTGTRMTLRLSMPVERKSHTAGRLRGKRGVVVTADTQVAGAMVHFGKALGLALKRILPTALDNPEPATFAAVDLLFIAEGLVVPNDVPSHVCVICLTEKPKPTGYRIVDDNVRLSVNPISWRGLGAACAAALSGLASVPSRQTGAIETGVAEPDRERAMASGRLVLVAEDHPVNQELIRHQLALLGFACDVVDDGAEALAALGRTRYGFLITDCHMPNLSGYELAREVRAREGRRARGDATRLPILGITANTAPEDLRACREAGMDDCLVKPTRLATLRDYLARWFGTDITHAPGETSQIANAGDTPLIDRSRPAPVPTRAFIPIDLAYMTQLWGSESTVKSLLDAFVSAVRDDLRALPVLLDGIDETQPVDSRDVEPLREWHHRVMGAAGVLQYPPLLELLERYRQGMRQWSVTQLRAEGHALAAQCGTILDGIEEQAALLA